MDKTDLIFMTIAIASIFIAIISNVIHKYKMKNTIVRLNQMLDKAISGNFKTTTYDESVLSSLEAKLSRYLSKSLFSENNLVEEKDRIKALISDISHQTKTPIANILLYSQLVNEEKELPDHCLEMINQITVQAEKLDFLIQALMKTSRLETGIVSVVPKSQSVSNLVTNVYGKAKNKAEKKNITITLNCMKTDAIFDEKWTEEVLYNILDNAVKYTPNGGEIVITVIPYEMFCRIDIADNGIGISEEDINSVFQRFFRSIDVNQYEGVGIGLFLAREIVTKQGGYIKVTSTKGQGSTFSIFLPT